MIFHLTSQMATRTETGPVYSQKAGILSGSPTWLMATQALKLLSVYFTGTLAGNWIISRTVRIGNYIEMGWKWFRPQLNLWCPKTSPRAYFLKQSLVCNDASCSWHETHGTINMNLFIYRQCSSEGKVTYWRSEVGGKWIQELTLLTKIIYVL